MEFYNINDIYENSVIRKYKKADRNIAVAVHNAMENYMNEMQNIKYSISQWDNLPSHIKEQGIEYISKVCYMRNLKRFFATLEGIKLLHYKYVQDIELKELLDTLIQDIEAELNNIKIN